MSLGSELAFWVLIISGQASEQLSLEQIQAFLEGGGGVGFKGQNREEVYVWVNQTLRQQGMKSETERAGMGAALCGKEDRIEPSTDDAIDHDVFGR